MPTGHPDRPGSSNKEIKYDASGKCGSRDLWRGAFRHARRCSARRQLYGLICPNLNDDDERKTVKQMDVKIGYNPTSPWRPANDGLLVSPAAQMARIMPSAHWLQLGSGVRPLALKRRIALNDLVDSMSYYRQRADEESDAAARATHPKAREIHHELSSLYSLLSTAGEHRRSADHGRIIHREALLDGALDDSFPASDPLAIVMPRRSGKQ